MVKSKIPYIPERGDVLWVNLNPTRGHEQKGDRPGLVLSPKIYNDKTGLIVVCPITSKGKDYPFEVFLEGKKVSGYVLSDQIKTLDWKERKVVFIEKTNISVLALVLGKIKLLLEI